MKVVRRNGKFLSLASVLAVGMAAGGSSPNIPTTTVLYRSLIRDEAARSLSVTVIASARSADPAVAIRGLLAAGRTKKATARPIIIERIGDRDPAVRAMAVYAFGLLAGTGPLDSRVLRRAADDVAPLVRMAAVDAIGRWIAALTPAQGDALAPLLVDRLVDQVPLVRGRAAAALVSAAETPSAARSGEQLRAAFEDETDRSVRWHEAWALRRGYSSVLAPADIEAGLKDPDELVRMQFIAAVGARKSPELVSLIQPLLRDPAWRVQEQAYETIKQLGGGGKTEHYTAIPSIVATPPPLPADTATAMPRPTASGTPSAPLAADARVPQRFLPTTPRSFDGPLPGPHPRVRITTTKGTVVVRLYPEWAPLTVANFLALTNRGYYDNLRWFRIVPNFVVQTGDPKDDGEGDAGFMIPAEENPLEQRAGVISMGLNYTDGPHPSAIRDSAGAQFYITLSPQLHLDQDFTVFGEVESGFSTLGRLDETDRMKVVEQISDD